MAVELEDIYAAGALVTAGLTYNLEARGSRFRFLFQEEATPILQKFYAGQLKLPARAFADQIRALKAVVHVGAGR
jgi:hypothetical protein